MRPRAAAVPPTTAYSSLASRGSTRRRKRILRSHASRPSASAAIDDEPCGLAVVDDGCRVLDVPLRVEHEQLGALAAAPGR